MSPCKQERSLDEIKQYLNSAWGRLVYARRLMDTAKEEEATAIAKYNNLLSEYTSSYPGLREAFLVYSTGDREGSGFAELQEKAFAELRQALAPQDVTRIGTQR